MGSAMETAAEEHVKDANKDMDLGSWATHARRVMGLDQPESLLHAKVVHSLPEWYEDELLLMLTTVCFGCVMIGIHSRSATDFKVGLHRNSRHATR